LYEEIDMPINIRDGYWMNTDLVCFTLGDGTELVLALDDLALLIETMPIGTALIVNMPSGAVFNIQGAAMKMLS
jgi:hypothetical protein